MEAIQFATRKGLIREQPRSWWYRLKLLRASGPMLSQSGNQLVYFDAYPEMKVKSLEIAREEIKDIQDLCLRNNIQLLVVLLPARLDVDENARREAAGSLRLTESQMDLNQDLKSSLISGFAQDHVPYLDLTAYLRGSRDQLFWNRDYHLNDKGHRLVAETVFDKLGPILIPGSPATIPPAYR